jgi:hypothetical protein
MESIDANASDNERDETYDQIIMPKTKIKDKKSILWSCGK